MYWHTKIKKYNLDILVSTLFAESKSFSTIAAECNKDLAKRPDHEKYSEVTPQNVKAFLEGLAKDNDRLRDNLELQKKSLDIPDVMKELKDICQSTKEKLVKASEEDNVLDYTRLHASFMDALKTIATIEGKLKNYVTLDFLNSHIVKIIEIIVKDPYIDSNDKRRLVTNIKGESNAILESIRNLNLQDEHGSKPTQEN